MSYNILNKGVKFQGATQGTIEDIVDTHSNQSITGSKDFQTLTGSNVHVKNNLGIGTTEPETKVHIQNGSAGTIATTDGALLTLESSEKPKIHFQSPNAYGGSIIFGSVADNDEGQIDYDHGSDRFLFKTGGNTKMTILGDNVGINTASPTEKLEVNGNIKTTGITATGTISGSGAISGSSFHGDGSALSGVGVSLASNGGLANSSGLLVDPTAAVEETSAADGHFLLIHNGSGLRKITCARVAGLFNQSVDSFTGDVNNRVLTSAGSQTINGEANLTFDGSTLTITGDVSGSQIVSGNVGHFVTRVEAGAISIGDATGLAGLGLANASGQLDIQVSGALKLASDKIGISGSLVGNGLIYDGGVDSISKINVRLQNNSGLFVEVAGLKTNFATLTSATPDVAADSIPFIDSAGDAKCSINTFLTQIAGSGISVSGNQLTAAGGGGSVDIDGLSALGGTGLHQTQDHFIFSDNGTEKKITFSNLEDAIFANVSSDATIAAGGALTIADNAVSLAKMAGLTRGNIIVGDSSGDPSALTIGSAGQLLVSDGDDLNYRTVSGDASLAADGTLTIANTAVEAAMLNSNVAGTGLDLGAGGLSVDVSDFMANGSDNRIVTAVNADSMNAEANLQFDGTTLSINGAEGDAGAYSKIVVRKTNIADNSATAIVRFTIPNANHAACFKIFGFVTTDSGSRVGTFEQSVAISRITNSAAVGATTSGILSSEANSGGGGANYTIASTVTQSGDTGASNNIDYNLTVNTTDDSTTNAVFYVELLNFNSTGITMAAV